MSELQDNVALAFRQWNEQRERIAALEAQVQTLREALLDLREDDFSCFTSECWDAHNEKSTGSKFEHIGKCLKARAALAATEEKL